MHTMFPIKSVIVHRGPCAHTRVDADPIVTGRIAAIRGVIPAQTLVHNDTASKNGTAGGTLDQPVLCFLVGRNPLWAA